jgi:RecA/RadA recombinase
MSDFLSKMIKSSGNKFASIVDDGLDGSDVTGFTDTGSMMLNALLSGSLYGGMANNKIVALAGEAATGKTYFTIGILSKFLQDNPEGVVVYFDTEQAVTSDMFKSRGVDPKRVAVFPVATIEEFRFQSIKIVDDYLNEEESK